MLITTESAAQRLNSPTLQGANRYVQSLPASAAVAHARALAQIVAGLDAEDDVVLGALLYPLLGANVLGEDQATTVFGSAAARIARESTHIASFGASAPLASTGTKSNAGSFASSAQQAESLRKMLLAIVTDPRLVVVRLADQLHRLRESKNTGDSERRRIAMETREIYAPLANRLGIWQLKWELEDLSFRYLNPEQYKEVAQLLASKRVVREQYIENAMSEIREALEKAGIRAEVAGRPKHIYSIWRKMQRKHLSFDQLYDIRAVRILVDTIADCYAALGVVHGMWPYIPGEFDDYIATPKDNLYRSLHTAVIGPQKLPLEIQIRTREMHEHAELGVAAHWTYKEGSRANPAYQQKINLLRQLLEPVHSDVESSGETDGDFLERVRAEVFEDRVYAVSPRGEVIELPHGATPLDYAYHVHTDLGHRCRGAKVNGRMVPLDYKLSNGDRVEIVAGKQLSPSRDWLVPSLGFLASQRNRAKVRAWFRKQDEAQNTQQGRQMLERELDRLGIHTVTLPELIDEFGFASAEQLYLALGEGELTIPQLTGAIQRRAKPAELSHPIARRHVVEKKTEGITISGVGDLLSTFAKCCRPVPPEPISGYITLGRGVSIHRQDCRNLQRLQRVNEQRVIPVSWSHDSERTFPVAIHVSAYDRRGLLRDVSAVLSDLHIAIQAMNTVTHARDGLVDMDIRIAVHDLAELSLVLSRIQGLANILSVKRQK